MAGSFNEHLVQQTPVGRSQQVTFNHSEALGSTGVPPPPNTEDTTQPEDWKVEGEAEETSHAPKRSLSTLPASSGKAARCSGFDQERYRHSGGPSMELLPRITGLLTLLIGFSGETTGGIFCQTCSRFQFFLRNIQVQIKGKCPVQEQASGRGCEGEAQ